MRQLNPGNKYIGMEEAFSNEVVEDQMEYSTQLRWNPVRCYQKGILETM